MTAAQLAERKSKIEATWVQFDEVQNEIEMLQDSAEMVEAHSPERSEYEETYYDIIARFQELIISRSATNLPVIEAHPAASRAPASKFHYLRSSLKGQAADIIQSLEVSAENYNEAWQMLKRRYDKKRIIIQRHIRALFELQSVSKENFTNLRHLVDGVLKHLRALKAIGRPTDSWDDVIIHLITSKLDHVTNKEWEDNISDEDIPTIQHLTDFLEHRCHTLEAVSRKAQSASVSQTKANQARVSSLASSGVASCQNCRGDHQIYSCERFLKLSPEDRLKVVKENKDCQGRQQTCRALLDSGSQSNFVTEDLVRRLGLQTRSIDISIVGVNNSCSRIQKTTQVQLNSRHYAFKIVIECLVLNRITERLPGVTIDKAAFRIPQNLPLADSEFHQSTDIDILLGAETFWNTLCVGQIKESLDHPLLQKTLFGWVIGGKYPSGSVQQKTIQCNVAVDILKLEQLVERFWQVEQISSKPMLTEEERECEENFKKTYHRNSQGRFVVQLPIKTDKLRALGSSYDVALKRFKSLELKLDRCPEMKKAYTKFIQEYADLNHMHPVVTEDSGDAPVYYMPHHAVYKDSSSTTRFRVVFDASSRTDTGVSLNDILMVGSNLQTDLTSILIKFRLWQYVLTADVEKMYRQVQIEKSQQGLQRILWRNNSHEEVQTFELATLTYGTASASFLAVRVLQETARLEQHEMPTGSARILSDFYVDDLLTGANTVSDLIIIRDETRAILSKAGFHLRKWASNEETVLEGIPDSASELILDVQEDTILSALGLQWNAKNDEFQFGINTNKQSKISKRIMLSIISRIFDPLGLLIPITITARILMQKLWQLKTHWDETVPIDIQTQWSRYEAELHEFNNLQIPRKVIHHHDADVLELCGFSDASEKAYGACVYVRSKLTEDTYQARLLCARSRVASLKNLTLPRLELCAAVLLAQLMHKVLEISDIKFTRVHYWSDSTITLSWIKSSPRR
ncbi:PREDICTED: uncharacterized protein LOC108757561 [Trachymyrmex cornetzi]|uniref:uncharacterized protein LOC108757561 n=1 Tax=Trachymyrmex cornetzi TaxID=471704 RepID=UPI00084F650B|nr:PREDICTED: uncharacterized protein LOC108757561 [Trachymyrmex cornetzi]